MEQEKSAYEILYDEIDNLALKMIGAPTKEEQKTYEIRLYEKIYQELIQTDGDYVYIKYPTSRKRCNADDFQQVVLYLLTPVKETGKYRYNPEKASFFAYLNFLCSKRKGIGFRTTNELFIEQQQREYQKYFRKIYGRTWQKSDGYKNINILQSIEDENFIETPNTSSIAFGSPETIFKEQHVPDIIKALTLVIQKLDMEEGEEKQEDVLYHGQLWIKFTYENIKYIKEKIDNDVKSRPKEVFEELKDLIQYMYPFALNYYYKTQPKQTADMYYYKFYETVEVKAFSLPSLQLGEKKLQYKHLCYCVNQFLADQGAKKPIKLDNMKKWMSSHYNNFIEEIRKGLSAETENG